MADEIIPKKMQVIYDEIVALIDEVCREHLNEEYADLSRKAAAALSRKRPSPLERGKRASWACGIVYALGQVNFLFDRSQTPHVSAQELADLFGVSCLRNHTSNSQTCTFRPSSFTTRSVQLPSV